MRMRGIESEAITAVGYDDATRVLRVRYSNGEEYEYLDVAPELYRRLVEAQLHPWSELGEEVKAHGTRRVR